MITEFDFAFIDKYREYIALYKENKLPVMICDSKLNVGWGNVAAEALYPRLTEKEGFNLLLGQFGKDELLRRLETGSSVWLDGLVGFGGVMLGLTPIMKEGGLYGAVAELMSPNAVILPAQARLSSQTPARLESVIRESVAGIFREMDIATNLEHMLLEKAELRGLGLDTGFISAGFDGISKHGYHLLRMAANLSAYTGLCVERPVLSLVSENIFGLILQAKEAIISLASGMGIPVEFSLSEDSGPVGLDAKNFELAFFNVLHNAFYFTREGNSVKISGKALKHSVSVTISDQGAGIPKNILPHVFDPYFARGHGLKSAGIGLGLTVAKAMVEAHQGKISVKSVNKKGTEVTITIPRGIFVSKPATLGSSTKVSAAGRFSPLYVGLVDAIRSPYNPQNKG